MQWEENFGDKFEGLSERAIQKNTDIQRRKLVDVDAASATNLSVLMFICAESATLRSGPYAFALMIFMTLFFFFCLPTDPISDYHLSKKHVID